MKGLMNKRGKKAAAFLLAFFMMFTAVFQYDVMKVDAAKAAIVVTESAGYEEGAYAEWASVEGADGYRAYVSKDGTNYTAIDNELIREYKDYWRVDTVGLTPGTYYIKVEAVKVDGTTKVVSVLSSAVTEALTVSAYDRSGFSFSSISRLGTGSGAYNEDGSLRAGAQVVYVTADTAKTCTAIVNGTEQTGLQAILDAKQKKGTENDILCIRIIGCVNAEDVDKFSSSSEGIQIKGKSSYNPMNITIEGIGEDATVSGFGFLVRNAGNVEFRNFAIMNFMDDGISLDTDNTNIWVHDMDFFYGSVGGDADQAKGDGTVDMKGDSQFITVAYNHFWDAGKASLCGMKSESGENYITYHHNWFDHSDSRHPRIRTMSVHVYNNYYDGNSKYGVGAAYQSQAFVEANYFNNCKYPMLISKQGSDVATDSTGTFSGEDGGIIKAYNNIVVGAQRIIYANSDAGTGAADATEFDAYLASTRDEQVPSTYSAKKGGKVYNNFDVNVDLGVAESAIDAPEDVPAVVSAKAGRLGGGDFQWDLSAESEDSNYDVISELKSAIVNYKSSVVSIGGLSDGVAEDGGDDTTEPDVTSAPEATGTPEATTAPSQPVTGAQIHNFTENGKESSFYTISGNLSTSKGTVTYNGLILTQCLKMESATNISFTTDVAGTLTLVFKETAKTVKIDGEKYTLDSNVFTVDLEAGTHTITKGDSINLFYMVFAPANGEEPVVTATPEPTVEPTEVPTATPEPTVEPTEVPTATPEPTVEPTEAPTEAPEPTVEPTDVPTEAPTAEPTQAPAVAGGYVHDFTENAKISDFFTINGKLSTSKGTVEYNGLTLTQCLKMETDTNISFTSDVAGTLTLVFKETAKKVKIDGEKYTLDSNVFSVDLEAGTHAITKGDSINLFYMVFAPVAVEEPVVTATPEPTEAPTEAPTAEPTEEPTATTEPTEEPTAEPTEAPTAEPTAEPTEAPTTEPTAEPTEAPTATPEPTAVPTAEPTVEPTAEPTEAPTAEPTAEPTAVPTARPTAVPTVAPTVAPIVASTAVPVATVEPTEAPTATPEPTVEPTAEPTAEPTTEPTAEPTMEPTEAPAEEKNDVVIQEEDVPAAEVSTENVQNPSVIPWIVAIAIVVIGAVCFGWMWKRNGNKE